MVGNILFFLPWETSMTQRQQTNRKYLTAIDYAQKYPVKGAQLQSSELGQHVKRILIENKNERDMTYYLLSATAYGAACESMASMSKSGTHSRTLQQRYKALQAKVGVDGGKLKKEMDALTAEREDVRKLTASLQILLSASNQSP